MDRTLGGAISRFGSVRKSGRSAFVFTQNHTIILNYLFILGRTSKQLQSRSGLTVKCPTSLLCGKTGLPQHCVFTIVQRDTVALIHPVISTMYIISHCYKSLSSPVVLSTNKYLILSCRIYVLREFLCENCTSPVKIHEFY